MPKTKIEIWTHEEPICPFKITVFPDVQHPGVTLRCQQHVRHQGSHRYNIDQGSAHFVAEWYSSS